MPETTAPAEALTMLTIYDRPRDFPDRVVVREWTIADGQEVPGAAAIEFADLAAARRHCAERMSYCLPRDERDDACIVETWI